MTSEQLEASRAERLRQNGHGALTLEDARTWLEETGLCLFLPKRQFASSITPTFVEAVSGQRNQTPDPKHIALAEELLVRLENDGVAVRLNLHGQVGEQPDYVVAAWVLPYVYALRGDRDWRRTPQLTGSRQVSQLAVQAYKLLEVADTNIETLTHTLGREVTETAVFRAITELWQQLRIIPVIAAPGKPAKWQLLRQRFQKAIAEGASTSQVTAISVLISIYLPAVIAASMEDVEIFLSPLTARSKVREVLRGLVATRQVHTLSLGHAPHFYVAGTLPEFATTPTYYTSATLGSSNSYFLHQQEREEEPAEPIFRRPWPMQEAKADPALAAAAQLAAVPAAVVPVAAAPVLAAPVVAVPAADAAVEQAPAVVAPDVVAPLVAAQIAAAPLASAPIVVVAAAPPPAAVVEVVEAESAVAVAVAPIEAPASAAVKAEPVRKPAPAVEHKPAARSTSARPAQHERFSRPDGPSRDRKPASGSRPSHRSDDRPARPSAGRTGHSSSSRSTGSHSTNGHSAPAGEHRNSGSAGGGGKFAPVRKPAAAGSRSAEGDRRPSRPSEGRPASARSFGSRPTGERSSTSRSSAPHAGSARPAAAAVRSSKPAAKPVAKSSKPQFGKSPSSAARKASPAGAVRKSAPAGKPKSGSAKGFAPSKSARPAAKKRG